MFLGITIDVLSLLSLFVAVTLTYGDYVFPKKRSEGRMKLFNSCTDVRAWSPNVVESTRYFRELNEHDRPEPGKLIPSSVVMENMIALTAQAQRELRVARRELQRYRSLNLTPEQRNHLKNFDRTTTRTDKMKGMKIGSVIRPLSPGHRLFAVNRIASLQYSDTCLSIYFHPNRFQYGTGNHPLLTSTRILRENLNPPLENDSYLVSRVTSCNILTEIPAFRGERSNATEKRSDQASAFIEYVDASSQVVQDVREVGVQTEECKNNDAYDKQSNVDSPVSQYYETNESVSMSESESGVNSDPDSCERSHKGVIIQKDSEIIVLKNELGMKEDELEELREMNRHLQALLQEKEENTNILKRNVNSLQETLNVVSDRRDDEMEDLSVKVIVLKDFMRIMFHITQKDCKSIVEIFYCK